MDFPDWRACGGRSYSRVSAPYGEGAVVEGKTGHDSTCGRYRLPVLRHAIVGARFPVLVPGLRSCQKLELQKAPV